MLHTPSLLISLTMFIESAFKKVDEHSLKDELTIKDCYIFGNSSRNKTMLEKIKFANIVGIFDNDSSKWGSVVDEKKVLAPTFIPNSIVLSAVGNPSSLVFQLSCLGYSQYYFFCESIPKISESEKKLLLNSSSKFIPSITNVKFIHLIPYEKFVYPLVEVLKQGFNLREHCFIVYSFNSHKGAHEDIYGLFGLFSELDKQYQNILLFDGIFNYSPDYLQRCLCIKQLISVSSKIIFHGEWLSENIFCLVKYFVSEFRQKGIFISWNGMPHKNPILKKHITEVLSHCRKILMARMSDERKVLMCNELNIASEKVCKSVRFSYALPFNKKIRSNIKKKILLNHSLRINTYENSVYSLELLKKFKGLVEIYCIASYGMEPKQNLKALGQLYFQDDFHYIEGFMSQSDYSSLINSIDVAVMSEADGSGMTTIRMLAYCGAKLYFRKNTATSDFASARGILWEDIENISGSTFEKFVENTYLQHNMEATSFEFDMQTKVEELRNILS